MAYTTEVIKYYKKENKTRNLHDLTGIKVPLNSVPVCTSKPFHDYFLEENIDTSPQSPYLLYLAPFDILLCSFS